MTGPLNTCAVRACVWRKRGSSQTHGLRVRGSTRCHECATRSRAPADGLVPDGATPPSHSPNNTTTLVGRPGVKPGLRRRGSGRTAQLVPQRLAVFRSAESKPLAHPLGTRFCFIEHLSGFYQVRGVVPLGKTGIHRTEQIPSFPHRPARDE